MVTPTTAQVAQLPPEQIGYLSAGPGRSAETALARLLDAGLVRVSRDGRVSAVHQNNHGATSRVETYILGKVRTPVSFNKIMKAAADSFEMHTLHRQLMDEKLMRRSRPRLGLWWLFLVIAGLLFVISVGEPSALFGAVALLAIAFWARGRSPLTRAGTAALGTVTASDRVRAVALYGFGGRVGGQNVGDLFELPRSVVRMIPLKRGKSASRSNNNSSCGTTVSSCSSCGSGCGSSSCGSSSGGSSCSSGSSSCGGGGCGGGGGGD
ncbi:TIGR04222 domain-containing membrane protein [Lentzea sp.]|uniref:TIGR04222 domain-containing membrane protein n=1 Tax=Lentzea sp. TaxID=56099 RepID=UPI002BC8A100|nr:TIGR04222 domain-containing membrane protein [Lentzea sp.]HUQ54140.1 TIGR04222 domain-containing membrane protein [Lentzea sp.]